MIEIFNPNLNGLGSKTYLPQYILDLNTQSEQIINLFDISIFGSFPFVPPQYVMRPPVTEHVPLHSKLLCKNTARASGGFK